MVKRSALTFRQERIDPPTIEQEQALAKESHKSEFYTELIQE